MTDDDATAHLLRSSENARRLQRAIDQLNAGLGVEHDLRTPGPRIPLRGGDEQDALSRRAKRLFSWRAGVRRRLKASYRRRCRRLARRAMQEADQ
jgi:hypothetical protein